MQYIDLSFPHISATVSVVLEVRIGLLNAVLKMRMKYRTTVPAKLKSNLPKNKVAASDLARALSGSYLIGVE